MTKSQQIRTMLAAGKSVKEIAKELDIRYQQVYAVAKHTAVTELVTAPKATAHPFVVKCVWDGSKRDEAGKVIPAELYVGKETQTAAEKIVAYLQGKIGNQIIKIELLVDSLVPAVVE